MGSVVKGATVLAGLDSGAIKPNTVFVDEPLKIKGTPVKKSAEAEGLGPLTYSSALKYSSNVFMFKTVMAMAGLQYHKNMTLPIKPRYIQRTPFLLQSVRLRRINRHRP